MSDNVMGYSDLLMDHFSNPKNILKVKEEEYGADGVGSVGNPTCGDMMKVWIKVGKEDERIKDLKWKTFGCASAIASTSVMSEMVTEESGMTLEQALSLKPKDIMSRLGGLPAIKIHCSVLGDKALRAAIHDYFEKTGQQERILEQKAKVVCNCLNVTDHEIEEWVLEGVRDFETLQEKCKIATGCTNCKPEAEKIFQEYLNKYLSDAEKNI
jgi:NifU-like protein involved in Fe-S cluster formation/bacterioferritin-associated ferredoxin